MRSMSTTILPVLAAAGLTLAACESSTPIDPKAATQKAALNAEAVMHETGLAVGFTVGEEGTVKKIMGSGNSAADSVVAPMLAGSQPPTAMLRAMVGPRVTRKMTGLELPSMMTPEEQFDEAGHELRRLMEERLFVDSNLESTNGDTATYLLHADPTCRPLPQDSDPPGTVPPIAADCAMDFEKVAVRITVTSDGDGVRFTVLVGPDRLELVTVFVHSDELAAQVNLPRAKAAAEYMQAQLGEAAPVQTFERLKGTLRASIKKTGAGTVKAAFSIVEALDIATMNGAAFTTAATDPLIAITGDGNRKVARLDYGLGATKVESTWDPNGSGVANRDFQLTIGGLYGHLSLDEAAKEVTMNDIGIGQTKVTVRGNTILDLNLNADTMRRYSGKLSANTDGTTRVEITPKIDVSLAFDYNAIAADFTTPPDPAIAHETYAINFANGGAPAVLQNAPRTATFAGGLKVVAGTLTLGVASAPAQTITVTAGRCLTSRDPVPEGSNPVIGKLVAADCP
jgi:hypothetical protein